MREPFEEIEHTADLAIRVHGATFGDLFTNAALGMANQLALPRDADPTVIENVELRAQDAETLLVAWLGELLYLGERNDCIFTDFELQRISETGLRARVCGRPIAEHVGHIKAVTFNELEIVRSDEGFEATVVFDV